MASDRDWVVFFSVMDELDKSMAEREEELAAIEAREDLMLESYLEERIPANV
jgi:hypothetical protein